MKKALMTGSMHISFKVMNSFRSYKPTEDTYYKRLSTEKSGGGHAVKLVGWGPGYWIMENSWGTKWGYEHSFTDPVTNETYTWHGLFNVEQDRYYVGYSCGYCDPDTSSVPHPFAEFLQ